MVGEAKRVCDTLVRSGYISQAALSNTLSSACKPISTGDKPPTACLPRSPNNVHVPTCYATADRRPLDFLLHHGCPRCPSIHQYPRWYKQRRHFLHIVRRPIRPAQLSTISAIRPSITTRTVSYNSILSTLSPIPDTLLSTPAYSAAADRERTGCEYIRYSDHLGSTGSQQYAVSCHDYDYARDRWNNDREFRTLDGRGDREAEEVSGGE